MDLDTSKFAVKYRPSSLDTFFGQKDIVAKIKVALQNNDLPSVLLITGQTGAGKTTLARLIAKAINNVETISQLSDIHEINIGANNTVECVEALVQQFNYRPRSSNHKAIYILDEVHTLTKASASSLLKVFEEPNKFNMFILCTNEPDKMLKTLKDRCHYISLNSYSIDDIKKLLQYVAEKESFADKINDKILETIAIQSNCSPRESLNLLQDVYFQIQTGKDVIDVKTENPDNNDIYTQANTVLTLMYARNYTSLYNYIKAAQVDCDALLMLLIKANECMLSLLFKQETKQQCVTGFVPSSYQALFDTCIHESNFKTGSSIQQALLLARQNLLQNIKVEDSILTYMAKLCIRVGEN